MRVDDWLARAAEALPERPALIAGDRTLSFAELEDQARTMARQVAGAGVSPGDRVALLLPPTADHVVLLHALTKLGAVAVPLDPGAPAPETDRLLAAVGPRLVVRSTAEVLAAPDVAGLEMGDAFDTEAVQCVIHTSGTAGEPTAVELTYGNHLWSAIGAGVRIGVAPTDRWLCCMPLHHIGGLSIVLRSRPLPDRPSCSSHSTRRASARRSSATASRSCRSCPRCSRACWTRGCRSRACAARVIGGGPAPQSLIERALEAGVPVAPTYGLTEAASQVATMPAAEVRERPGSAGPPILNTEVRIDEQGRICVRGPTIAPGQPARTAGS